MAETRVGSQSPTSSVILPYTVTDGDEAIALYESSGRTARDWQKYLIKCIMGRNDEDLWTHAKFGWQIPRRNGKGEVLVLRELWGLAHGEMILHTAHRTTTVRAAWERINKVLADMGYSDKPEGNQKKKKSNMAFGRESITIPETGGRIDFRTRTNAGGLGEGFDLLIIDEAQEYTIDQESTLQYIVTDSQNPQTLFCGTPPTAVSRGTVFMKMRDECLSDAPDDTGWAEWSVDEIIKDTSKENADFMDALYMANPSLGCGLTLRSVLQEDRTNNVDFNIQRLGLWLKYNLQSAVTRAEWDALKVDKLPKFKGKLHVGIQFGVDGKNIAMSVAVKTDGGRFFVETLDCVDVREGTGWIIRFLQRADVRSVYLDGKQGHELLQRQMADARLKPKPTIPDFGSIIAASAFFESCLYDGTICHAGQPSLAASVTNCQKKIYGSSGGFVYQSIREGVDNAIMKSMILALYSCSTVKEVKQTVHY